MEEIILQTLIKMRTDYSNNEMIIFAQDSDLKVVADEIKTAINYTHSCESDSEQLNIYGSSTRTFNELEMLAEDLECVKMWLDDKKAPKTDINGNEYSVVGRIQCLLNVC